MPSLVFAALAAISFFLLVRWVRRRMEETALRTGEEFARKLLELKGVRPGSIPKPPVLPELVFRELLASVRASERMAGFSLYRLEWYEDEGHDVVELRATPGGSSEEEGYGELVAEFRIARGSDEVLMRTHEMTPRPVDRDLAAKFYLPRISRRVVLVGWASNYAEAV